MKTREQEPKYWRSLDELNRTPAFEAATVDEFAGDLAVEEMDGTTRRHFLGIMGASMAMSGLAGCVARRPEEYIMPYARQPEDVLPGIPNHYATVAHVGGDVVGLLVESNEGRPTKIEGNPSHPVNLGRTNSQHQGMVLDLYDPARLKTPRRELVPTTWDAAADFVREHFRGVLGKNGQGLAVLTRANPSPTFFHLRDRLLAKYPAARWYTYEAISQDNQRRGLAAAFGQTVRPFYRLNKAWVVVSLDSDFLATEQNAVSNAALWSALRRVDRPDDEMSRLYVVEGVHSVTGSNADHRLALRPSEVEGFAFALADALQRKGQIALPADLVGAIGGRVTGLSDAARAFADAIADDLLVRATVRGGLRTGVVIAGRRQPPVVHALAAAINGAIGAIGATVDYYVDYTRAEGESGDMADIRALTESLNGGQVDTLLVLGGNPVYDAPGDLHFGEAFMKAATRIVLADQPDETARKATWALPRAHFLETWGDLAAIDGTLSIQQPLIDPLYGAWSEIELLARVLGDEPTDGYTLVRGYWKQKVGALGFYKKWRRWLHDGVFRDVQVTGVLPAIRNRPQGAQGLLGPVPAAAAAGPRSLELVFLEDIHLHDGRYANNSWLQEAPDPMTKLVWDNVVTLSPATAATLSVANEDRVSVEVAGKAIDLVAWIMPGQADDTATVTLGYGRRFDNYLPYHDEGTVGFDVNPLRPSTSPDLVRGAVVAKRTGTYPLATVQPYDRLDPGFGYERRPMVRETTLAKYPENTDFAKPGIIEHGKPFPQGHEVAHPPTIALHPDPIEYTTGHQWGMVIDLNTCTGCNTCIVACQAENNIMSVGKDQVRRGREMHWIRIDRYFTGSPEAPQVVHQPIVCMQCEMAPCENVCPVAATVHSPQGLNDMVYNRCIGTRYCSNNCPFKVRKFNFYNYAKGQPETYHMVRNPDVTVRFRGVMEKCTYCVQRIKRAERRAAQETDAARKKAEIDAITPACAQACPPGAIVFGDILDKESRVAKQKAHDRDYGLLTELNVRPRTSYLAKVRNPNPKLVG
ncbi:MAG: TAT-variant-translocated molybdopterin oxidoreductase [Myxococcales bacterium]|nr:TAT-variant-translocated molybdopterin oxidoreductase [Myxococcales bacterium]MCB9551566.1 TAT-variant-translocated molybdopterin oxidoreductase [Myxococcales bacterium]